MKLVGALGREKVTGSKKKRDLSHNIMSSESNPMIMPQAVLLLTYWIKKARLFLDGVFVRECLQHSAQQTSRGKYELLIQTTTTTTSSPKRAHRTTQICFESV
jgi:hypothetical protein